MMNSNYGKSNTTSGSLNAFNFDLGLNSTRSKSLNDQKNPTSSSSYTYTSSTFQQPKPSSSSTWTHQPASSANKPTWTHQPASVPAGGPGGLSGPTSMVGDIFGKSWSSSTSSATSSISTVGVVNKNPNLFGDLVNSALGQNKGGSSGNVPLKNATPVPNKSAYSMGGMADSLPKNNTNSSNYSSTKGSGGWGSSDSFGSFTSGYSMNNSGGVNNNRSTNVGGGINVNFTATSSKSPNLGGPSMKTMSGSGGLGGSGSNKDPFGSLFDTKPKVGTNSGNKGSGDKNSSRDDDFGNFQNASKNNGSSFSSTTNNASAGGAYSNLDEFAFPSTHSQPSVQSSGGNDFDVLFSSSSGGGMKVNEGSENQQFSGGADWGMDSEFVGNDSGGTTELEGLPPPPAGVSASAAKNKGMDNYKQGQYADAIKWLSWAVVLLEKAGDSDGTTEVLSSRASCYKEVGEYKKAVADCTKVLEHDDANVSVLVQRALLYESMEKYKLGAEDLRTVMKIDPGNRVARSTIHRLLKMAE